MPEKTLNANGIDIWTEDFGNPVDTPTLLIMGASSQAIRWPDELIDSLVAAGRYVIRYDNRDVGQSACFDFAAHPYTLDDMALDAVGVLDGYGIESAHIVGPSMAGMITQLLMLNHRPRVRSATIIMSTPLSGGGDAMDFAADGLPGTPDEFMAKLLANLGPAATREERISQHFKLYELLVGSAEPFDEASQHELATREVDRARDFAKRSNHQLAIARTTPSDRRPMLKSVEVPTLVVHGTEDPIFPLAHGKALADAIPGTELMTMEGAGHEMPRCT